MAEFMLLLNANESPYPPSPAVQKLLHEHSFDFNRYPPSDQQPLISALSRFYRIPETCLFAGNGSEEAIALIVRATLAPGSNIVVSENSFVMTSIHARTSGAEIIVAAERGYRVDVQSVLGSVNAQTRMVYICSPNNPTGSYTTREELQQLAEALPQEVLLLVDAAYAEFALEADYDCGLHSVFDPQGRVAVTHTFSKAYGLASQRIGWAAAPLSVCQKVKQIRTPFNTNSIALQAATAALSDQGYLHDCVNQVIDQRRLATSALQDLGCSVVPSAANFILITQHLAGNRLPDLYDFLLHHGVHTLLTENNQQHAIRITIGHKEEMKLLLQLIETWLIDKAAG